MTIAEFSHKVELHFWNWAIPTLSVSPLVQRGVRLSYRCLRLTNKFRWYWLSLLVSALGFINGLLAFQLFAALRAQ